MIDIPPKLVQFLTGEQNLKEGEQFFIHPFTLHKQKDQIIYSESLANVTSFEILISVNEHSYLNTIFVGQNKWIAKTISGYFDTL